MHLMRRIVPLVGCALAFALCLPLLDTRSLWGDEAFSVWAGNQPPLLLLAGLDAQPPLYHLMLAAARPLFGDSVFAIRFVSVLCVLPVVAVGARIAAVLSGPRSAALAAILLALSPMLIYYGQEARMYAPAALFAAAACWMTARAVTRRGWHAAHTLIYTLCTLAALYSHFYTLPVLLVNTAVLLWALRHQLGHWLLAHSVVALGFGGWFFGLQWQVLRRSTASGNRSFPPPVNELVDNLQRGLSGLWFGLRTEAWMALPAVLLTALALFGWVRLARGKHPAAAWLGAGWVLVSALFVFATASRSGIVPDFNPRYLLFTLMPLLIGLALAAQVRPATLTALLTASGLLASLYGVGQLQDTRWQKSRYAEMLATLNTRARADDGVALLNSDQFPLLDYYGPVTGTVWIVDNGLWGDTRSAELSEQVTRFTGQHSRVWLVKYGWASTPGLTGALEQATCQTGARLYFGEFDDVTLSLYERIDPNAPAQPLDLSFGGQIGLTGVRPRGDSFGPGDGVSFDLIWRAMAKPETDYTVFVHIRNADTGAQIAAFDSQPANGAAPTSSWQLGQTITDTRGIQLPADAPPGRYNVVIGLYRFPSFERLALSDGQTEAVVHVIEIR
jgi:mannosyltransferase